MNEPAIRTLGHRISSPYVVEHLSDAELLAGTRGLVARSNHQLACLIAHLGEVEARGIYRERACSSLCTYCIYELRLSEDTAFRYARAARLARKFPSLLQQIAAGEIHLSGIIALGPHLTDENHREVLQLAKHRTKREIMKLVRRLDPLPDVPSRIEPLGPARPVQSPRNSSWGTFMHSLNPVRELRPEERPKNWINLGEEPESGCMGAEASTQAVAVAAVRTLDNLPGAANVAARQLQEPLVLTRTVRGVDAVGSRAGAEAGSNFDGDADAEAGSNSDRDADTEAGRNCDGDSDADIENARPLVEEDLAPGADATLQQPRSGKPLWLDPQRYSVQFTATQEYVDLVERAKNLMSHAAPQRSLEEIHLRAMRLLVAHLEKRRFAVGCRPPTQSRSREAQAGRMPVRTEDTPALISEPNVAMPGANEPENHEARVPERRVHGAPERELASDIHDAHELDSDTHDASEFDSDIHDASEREPQHPTGAKAAGCSPRAEAIGERQGRPERVATGVQTLGSRYIPAEVRRQLYRRDGGRCAYVAPDGQRCREAGFLEIQHHVPHARGGAPVVENLALYCRSHNALAAEQDFGRSYMVRRSGRE